MDEQQPGNGRSNNKGKGRYTPMAVPGREIKQERGRKTYDALIRTAFDLLQRVDFEAITVAALAQAAGYSVGAFYARFDSKDQFFDAMMVHHLDERTRARERLFSTVSNERLVEAMMADLVSYYWKRRGFWRAALVRSMRDPEFWGPIGAHGRAGADALIARINEHRGSRLTKTQATNVRFAFQTTLGTINSAIINRPGPVAMGRKAFTDNLARAFRAVSDYDRLLGLVE